MAFAELKELKLQLYLLDMGFIQPSISPWELRYCLLRRRMDPIEYALTIINSIKSLIIKIILFIGLKTCLINSKGHVSFLKLTYGRVSPI